MAIRNTRLATAMHEAGHAVAHLAKPPAPNIRSISVVEQREALLGLVDTDLRWQMYMTHSPASAGRIEELRRLAWHDIVVCLAGPLAEFRWRRHSRWAIKLNADSIAKQCLDLPLPNSYCDEAMVRSRLCWAYPGEECDRFVTAWWETEELVATHWRAITSIGRTLNNRGMMTGDELETEWSRFAF